LEEWRDEAPKGFVFSTKASRYITHMKKLKDPQASTKKFYERIVFLGEKLGPILFQLPPHWKFNRQRLEEFLASLNDDFRYAFEFRDQSWINNDTYDLLKQHNAAFCIYEFAGYLSPKKVTTDFVYIRLHGPKGAYQGNYTTQRLNRWADDIFSWADKGRAIYCYFDNDEAGYAAQNALHLQSILSKCSDSHCC
jgi:uncharacterized protein YecE (DUF72 family)